MISPFWLRFLTATAEAISVTSLNLGDGTVFVNSRNHHQIIITFALSIGMKYGLAELAGSSCGLPVCGVPMARHLPLCRPQSHA
jgi:hypothetical protein